MKKRYKNSKMVELRFLFLWGLLAGFLCFVITYGIEVLNVTYDAWIFHGDTDLKQHYLGWCHYRITPWHFPLGMIDSLSYPTSVSMLWTDSIPIFSIVFKLFRSILPETFQFFGLFACLSFGLQGGIATLLIRKFTDNLYVCLVMSVVFIWSFPILQRTFYHTSLCAQWIILLSLLLWFSDIYKRSTVSKAMIWGAMGMLCVFIHSYFLPMVACIMCGSLLEELIIKKKITPIIASIGSFGLCSLISLYVIGAFAGNVSLDYGIGQFEMNLNSLWNSLGEGRLLKGLPLYFDTQYEGFGYLGAGMIVLGFVFMGIILFEIYISHKNKIYIVELIKMHPRKSIVFLVCTIFLLVAACPNISLGNILILHIPYPKFINSILGIFRSNGRFVWPVMYIIIIASVAVISKKFKKQTVSLLISFCLLLQLVDLSTMISQKREIYSDGDKSYTSIWDTGEINQVIDHYDHFILMLNDNDLVMTTAYYAYANNMTLNRYYYARDIDKQIEKNLEVYVEGLLNQKPEENCIYLFDEETVKDYKDSGLHFYEISRWIFGTRDSIEGLTELKIS